MVAKREAWSSIPPPNHVIILSRKSPGGTLLVDYKNLGNVSVADLHTCSPNVGLHRNYLLQHYS